MKEISAELKDKMLKNAEIILSRDLDIDGLLDCSGIQIKCKECPLSSLFFNNGNCRVSKRSYGKVFLQNWYNENKPKENKMEELQTIDTSKWQWMMVSSNNVYFLEKRIVFSMIGSSFVYLNERYNSSFLENQIKEITNDMILVSKYAKPIEQRKNTALDVMWWGEVRKVFKYSKGGTIYAINLLSESVDVSKIFINELHLVNGHAEIKHETWLTADELEII